MWLPRNPLPPVIRTFICLAPRLRQRIRPRSHIELPYGAIETRQIGYDANALAKRIVETGRHDAEEIEAASPRGGKIGLGVTDEQAVRGIERMPPQQIAENFRLAWRTAMQFGEVMIEPPPVRDREQLLLRRAGYHEQRCSAGIRFQNRTGAANLATGFHAISDQHLEAPAEFGAFFSIEWPAKDIRIDEFEFAIAADAAEAPMQ